MPTWGAFDSTISNTDPSPSEPLALALPPPSARGLQPWETASELLEVRPRASGGASAPDAAAPPPARRLAAASGHPTAPTAAGTEKRMESAKCSRSFAPGSRAVTKAATSAATPVSDSLARSALVEPAALPALPGEGLAEERAPPLPPGCTGAPTSPAGPSVAPSGPDAASVGSATWLREAAEVAGRSLRSSWYSRPCLDLSS
mmetsp:Transcript_45839/g.103539  ORF Transcript_45839/g.103539 Transcript_45839/m.103539 type:complete len:203 (+) Transcript_45839:373-981(+)